MLQTRSVKIWIENQTFDTLSLSHVFFITKKINSVDYKLDLKLTLEDDKSCERGSVEKDNNDESKRAKFGILIASSSGFS